MGSLVSAKLKALAVHLLVTGVITAVSAVLVFWVWYPDGLYKYLKGGELYTLIVVVELVLGPLMTLIIFNPCKSKKEMITDYALVGALQVGALAYGIYSTFISRPVYEVFVVDRIEFIAASELAGSDLDDAPAEYSTLPLAGYRSVCVERPADAEARSNILFTAISGKDIELYPQYYRACAEGELVGALYSGERLEAAMRAKGQLSQFGQELPSGEFGWLPVKSRFGAWVKIFPSQPQEESYYLDFDPWDAEPSGEG